MFEIVLNAVKVALSKQARESATALINLFRASPEWQNDICTLTAKVGVGQRERTSFVEELIIGKLRSLQYGPSARRAYRCAFRELSANAFEHGARGTRQKVVRLTADITEVYASICFENPAGSPAHLDEWLKEAGANLEASDYRGRGRGLLLVRQAADVLMQEGPRTVKAVVYRDRVVVKRVASGDKVLVFAAGGFSNPSFARRIVDEAAGLEADNVVISLDEEEGADSDDDEICPSRIAFEVLQLVSVRREQGRSWKISTRGEALRRLLPAEVLHDGLGELLRQVQAECSRRR